MNGSATTICMYVPSAMGGHPLYASELLHAMVRAANGSCRFELATSRDLDPQFNTDAYAIHAILRPLVPRDAFSNRLSWVTSRLHHYTRRDLEFLKWLEKRPDIDAVHFQEWTPWLSRQTFRRVHRMGKRVFLTVHNVVPHSYPPGVPRSIVDGWLRSGYLAADALFVLTDRLRDELASFLGDERPPIHVVPHGVWTVHNSDNLPDIQLRLSWKKLLFFGQIRRNKGLHLLLAAADQLRDYSITIAGDPKEKEYFDAEIVPVVRRLRAGGARIEMIDRFVTEAEAADLMNTHSAVVMPYTDGFVAQSGVVFMAMAHEVPTVASGAGGLRELLEQFKIGVTLTQTDPAAIAAAVRQLHEHPNPRELVARMRAAREHFSWDAAAASTLAGYALSQEQRRSADDCRVETTPAF